MAKQKAKSRPSGAIHKRLPTQRSVREQVEHEGSVRFDRVDGVEFWITATNKIFLIFGEKIIAVSLRGSSNVSYEGRFLPGPVAHARVLALLQKQRQIRGGWLSPAEEQEAWTFN